MKRLIICSNKNCEHGSEANPFEWDDSHTLEEGSIATTPQDDLAARRVIAQCPSCRTDNSLYFSRPTGEIPLKQDTGYGYV